MKNISRHRVESNVVHIDFTLNRARLIGPLEISGYAVAVLGDLYVFDFDRAVPGVGGVNRPIALHVVGWLLGKSRATECQRYKGDSQLQRGVGSLHNISP